MPSHLFYLFYRPANQSYDLVRKDNGVTDKHYFKPDGQHSFSHMSSLIKNNHNQSAKYNLPFSSSSMTRSSNISNSVKTPSSSKPIRLTKIAGLSKSSGLSKVNNSLALEALQTSLVQPITIILLSYLASRVSNSTLLQDKIGFKKDKNMTDNESRTLSSWLSGLASKLKKSREPSRKDHLALSFPAYPIPFDPAIHPLDAPHLPPNENNGRYVIPNFMTNLAGFPDPLSPESILLPPELIESSGIKYWLNFIEKMSSEDNSNEQIFDMPSAEVNDFSSYKRTKKKSRPRPNIVKGKRIKIPVKTFVEEATDSSMDEEDGNDANVDKSDSNGEISKPNISPRCDKFTSHICVDDFEYPEQAILDEIYKRRDIFELMYSEVTDDVPLVDGIAREVEESYNYDHYYNEKDEETHEDSSEHSGYSKNRKSDSSKEVTGFVCPSEVLYGKPKLARNFKGKWKVIVNAGDFTQTIRMEKCFKPNDSCNYVKGDGVNTRCAQINSLHRLLVFEKGKGFFIDTFRIPTACSCYASKKQDHPLMKNTSKKSQVSDRPSADELSNTLWSILGNVATQNSGQSYNSIGSDILKSHYLLQQLNKNYPQLMTNQMSPSVIQQFTSTADMLQNVPTYSHSGPTQQIFTTQISAKPSQNSGEYFLPGMMYAEEPISFSQTTQIPSQRVQAGTTLTTGANSPGAPLVQVIHVPLSTQPISPQIQHHHSQLPPYLLFKKNNGQDDYSYYSFTNNMKPDSKDEIGVNEKDLNSKYYPIVYKDDYMNRYIRMTNESKLDRMFNEGESRLNKNRIPTPVNKFDADDNALIKRKNYVNSESNKKVNFSYHPILEYINPEFESKKQ